MKNNKSKSIIFTFLVVTLLVSGTFGSFGFSTNSGVKSNNVKISTSSKVSVTNIKLTSKSVTSLSVPINYGRIETFGDRQFNETNFVVADSKDDEYYPTMVVSGVDALVAYELETEGKNRICLRNSEDFGNTWSSASQLVVELDDENPNIEVNSPSFCIVPNGKEAYGTFTSPFENSAITGILLMNDIRNLNDRQIFALEWTEFSDEVDPSITYDFWDFQNPDIIAYEDQTTPWIFGLVGSTNYTNQTSGEGPCSNSPMIFHLDLEDPSFVSIVWFPAIENCSNLSFTNDYDSDIIYGVCEKNNGTKNNLLFFDGNPEKWIVDEIFTYQNFTSAGNLTHPQIFAQDNQIYIVAEIDANGKNDIIIFNSTDGGGTWDDNIVTSNQPPEASFSYSMERLNVSFFDESTDIDGYITSWFWEFGDDDNSTTINPQHEYATPGTYKVNLTIEDNYEGVSIFSKTIVVNNTTPIADFSYEPISPSANVNIFFNSTSTAYPGLEIVSYTWDFGDGSNLEYEQNVTHQYTDNGTYIVSLTIIDDAANIDSIEKILHVGLIADFTYDPIAPTIDDIIIFNDASSTSDGSTITNWTWNFDDGTELIYLQNPTHQYMSPGVYSVTLTIKDGSNNENSILKEIIVKPRFSSFIPRFPMVVADETSVFCSYSLANNLLIVNSSDHGEDWGYPTQLNDKFYSVVEEYRFSDLPDSSHVIWTDNREEGNYDLYTAVKGLPDIDLMVIPESVNISKSEIPFLSTNNWIKFTVKNVGQIPVNDIKVVVTINRVNQSGGFIDPLLTNYPVTIKNLGGNLPQKSIERPLFRIYFDEFISALINFAGIQSITVTIDPDNQFSESDLSNNAYTLENITYDKIFPKLAKLENIFILLN